MFGLKARTSVRRGSAYAGRAVLMKAAGAALGLALVGATVVPASALDVIRFGGATMFFPQGSALVGVVAPEIFAKHGIQLEPTDFKGSSPNATAAFVSGSVDVLSSGLSFTMDAVAEGADCQVIFATARPLTDLYLSTKTVERLGVSPTAPIADRLKALKGLTIASNGGTSSSHWLNLNALLSSVNMGADDVTLRAMSDPTAIMAAIRYGQIDGAVYSTGNLAGLLTDKAGVRWLSISREDAPQLFDVPYTGICASSSWIAANPDLVQRFRAALIEALDLMKTQKAVYSKLIKDKYAPNMEQALWDATYDQVMPALFEDGKVTRKGWDTLMAQRIATTGKDYTKAAYDTAVADVAKAD